MCNQLPSGSFSAAGQVLGLLVSLADLERSLTRQPSRASVQPSRCQEWGNSVTRCASHFIYSRYRFGCVVLTKDTLKHRKGTFVRCHNALHQSREYIANFDWKKERKENLKKEVPLALVLCHLLYFHPAFTPPSPPSSALHAGSLCL